MDQEQMIEIEESKDPKEFVDFLAKNSHSENIRILYKYILWLNYLAKFSLGVFSVKPQEAEQEVDINNFYLDDALSSAYQRIKKERIPKNWQEEANSLINLSIVP